MKAKHWAIIVLLLLGVVKMPLEQQVSNTLRANQTLNPPPDLGLRENLSQMSFAATLGGLRSLVASISFLQAITAFENVDWPKVDSFMALTTRLQPRVDFYWETAADHMAYDAASYYRDDESRAPFYRKRLYREHVERGVEILKEGLQHLPTSKVLEEQLGHLYARRIDPPDFIKAGEHYHQAFLNGGLPITERLSAYAWAMSDDETSLRKAYAILQANYQRGNKLPGILTALNSVETKLNIPMPQRVGQAQPQPK